MSGKTLPSAKTGSPGEPAGEDASSSGPEGGDDAPASAVDSFLREAARAPSRTPASDTALSAGQAPTRSTASLTPGEMVAGRFRLEKPLGEGGMGVVWQAVHSVTRKPVALKFLKREAREGPDGTRAVQRFLREARASCAVRHPNVVEVHDVLELDDGAPVMVMDLLTGETLAQRLARTGNLPLVDAARILGQVASAVGCAHALGIVHRDLKPENVFLAETHAGEEVKVLDFGIAKLTATEGDAMHTGATTGTGAILGTPYYMAPEQLFGEKDIDRRVDVWAMGIILYECLAGERPTQASNVGQIFKLITSDGLVPLSRKKPDLPAPVLDLVRRMLSRDRAARPSDVRELLDVLGKYTDATFVQAAAPSAPLARDSATTPEPADDVDPNAPTIANAGMSRSGVVVHSSPPASRSTRRVPPLAIVAVALVAAAGAGVAVWGRSAPSSIDATPAVPPSIAPPVPTTAASDTSAGASALSPAATAPSSSSLPGAPSTAPSARAPLPTTPASPATAPSSRSHTHPAPSSASAASPAAATPSAAPRPTASSRPAAPAPDPASYQ